MFTVHLHRFTPNDGVSGVAVHEKGHVTIKTWPDRSFAAIDLLFMAQSADVRERLVKLVEEAFAPSEVVTNVCKRAKGTSRPNARLAPQQEEPQAVAKPRVQRKPQSVVRDRIARAA